MGSFVTKQPILAIQLSSATLNMIFSVTYYLELRIVISIYYTSHILPTKVKLVVWTL